MTSASPYKPVYDEIMRVCPSSVGIFQGPAQMMLPSMLARDLANHLLELYRIGHVEEFPSLSIQIEKFYQLSDSKVREWATLGILEAIQSVWSATEVDPQTFRRYLMSQSVRDWDRLAAFWSTGTGNY